MMKPQLVLIIENGLMNRKKITDSLHKVGYDVQFASDTETALTILNHSRPLFILVSLILLRIDTCTFSRILKNDEDTRDITIVGLSNIKQSKARMLYCGMDGLINMTETSIGLVKRIKEYINKIEKNKIKK